MKDRKTGVFLSFFLFCFIFYLYCDAEQQQNFCTYNLMVNKKTTVVKLLFFLYICKKILLLWHRKTF